MNKTMVKWVVTGNRSGVKFADHYIGQVLDALDESAYADDTINELKTHLSADFYTRTPR